MTSGFKDNLFVITLQVSLKTELLSQPFFHPVKALSLSFMIKESHLLKVLHSSQSWLHDMKWLLQAGEWNVMKN